MNTEKKKQCSIPIFCTKILDLIDLVSNRHVQGFLLVVVSEPTPFLLVLYVSDHVRKDYLLPTKQQHAIGFFLRRTNFCEIRST